MTDSFDGSHSLVEKTFHDSVRFEVLVNTYDMLARNFRFGRLNRSRGDECSHITSSCNVRWLWFPARKHSNFGHSRYYYSLIAATEYARGWEDEEEKRWITA